MAGLSRKAISRLGKVNDTQLAAEESVPVAVIRGLRRERGITANAVFSRRVRVGIKPCGPSRDQRRHRWTKRELSWLGKLSDSEIARRLQLDQSTVATRRGALGIAAVQKGRTARVWTKSELALLGKLTDSEIARRMKISRRKVSAKRAALGIQNPVAATQAKRWNEKTLALLGTKPDAVIAKRLKLAPASVAGKRRQLGIAAPGK